MKKNEIHILVVDDEPGVRDLLAQIIERAGYKASKAATPAEAENIVKLKTVHLAIIDCMLPIINGIDLTKKLLATTLRNAPVILISGIFKDEQFAEDAKKKSGAVDFFSKPFDTTSLLGRVGELVSPLFDAKTGSLESLLTKTDVSKRESRKTLDFLEDITGYDFMLALSVLMKAKCSGYINVTDQKKNLTGFTIVSGELTNVDSLQTLENLKSDLVGRGLVTDVDFNNVTKGASKTDILGYLVSENLISPHMERIIKIDKIMADMKRLFEQGSLNVNFAESAVPDESSVSISLSTIEPVFYENIIYNVPVHWMKNFYSNWYDKVILKSENFSTGSGLSHLGPGESTKKIVEKIRTTPTTIAELVESTSEKEAYPIIHFLVVARLICFANESKLKNLNEHITRLKEMLQKIENKNPFEVFNFFGAGENPPPVEVDRIYRDFAKSNHPDKLPKSATQEMTELNNRVFAIVSESHKILVDADERRKYVNNQKQEEARNQIRAEEKMEKSIPLLERAKFQEAYVLMSEANELYDKSIPITLYYLWSMAKADPKSLQKELGKYNEKLAAMDVEDKKNPLYYFVSGLLSALEADFSKAERFFIRALDYDKNFISARRELIAVQALSKKSGTKSKTSDFLSGDITSIVSGLFNKKKSG